MHILYIVRLEYTYSHYLHLVSTYLDLFIKLQFKDKNVGMTTIQFLISISESGIKLF